jgi:hypothetical protein
VTATSKLALELLANAAANQTLANVTFAQLNQLVQAGVIDKDLATPPGSPSNEALYIVAGSPTGAWSGKAGQLAYWLTSTGAWQFVVPREGFLVHVNDEDVFYKYDGSAWAIFSSGGSFTGGTLTSALNEAPTVTLASAATVNIGAAAANTVSVTGTTTITAFDTIAAGAIRRIVFAGALTLTHNGTSLILPGAASITTAAGDVAQFLSLGSGNWRCVSYQKANGQAVVGGSFTGGTLTSALNEAPQVTLASASTMNIGAAAANTISVTGTTTITAFDTIAAGAIRRLVFAGALTLTHNAMSLILPNGANIITGAGDVAEFVSLGSGNWRCVNYQAATILVKAYNSSDISLPTSTFTSMVANTTVYEVGGDSHNPSTNNNRLVAPVAGYYLFGATVVYSFHATGQRMIRTRVNDTTIVGQSSQQAIAISAGTTMNALGMVYLNAGDYLSHLLFQDSGSTLNATSVAEYSPSMWMMRIG